MIITTDHETSGDPDTMPARPRAAPLNNLSNWLGALGRCEDASLAAAEAARIRAAQR